MLLSVIDAGIVTGCGRKVQGSRSPKRRHSAKVSGGLLLTRVPALASRRGPRVIQPKGSWWVPSRADWFAEAELGPVDPHSVEDSPELTRESNLGPLRAPALGDGHCPGLEPRPGCHTGHDDVRGLKQRDPD